MRNGWRCWKIDLWRPALAALGVLAALASAQAIWGSRGGGTAGLYRERCSTCHALPDLSRIRQNEIAGIVRTMRVKNGADKVISGDEADQITGYLEEKAGK